MKMKQVAALAFAGVLCTGMLAACGNTEQQSTEAASTQAASTQAASTEAAAEAAVEEAAAEAAVEEVAEEAAAEAVAEEAATEAAAEAVAGSFAGFDETINISMYGMSFFGDGGVKEVNDAINEISKEAINVTVDFTVMDVATYMQQIGLMLSGGEAFDLVMDTAIPVTSFPTFMAQKQLLDISEYLPEYAPETYELMQDYIGACEVNGGIYGIPSYRQYNSNYYIVMRKDILDELKLTEQAEAIDSWTDFEAIMEAVSAAQDSLPDSMKTTAMICNYDTTGNIISGAMENTAAEDFADCYGMDVLAQQNKMLYVDENGTVQSWFETDDYKAIIDRVHSWYEKGYVYKDSATSTETGDTMMANGVTFSFSTQSEYGIETAKRNATGYDVLCVPIVSIPVQSQNGNTWAWSVPVTSENPEAAVAFMNLMWTNADIMNLLVWGVEGRDYEVNDEGEAVLLESKQYQSGDWWFGNQFLAYPAEGNGGDFRELALADMLAAEMSPYYGCVVDTNGIANEITAVSNVLTQYEPALESGTADPATVTEMIDGMKAAGLDTILAEYQAQLDAWLANQ